MFLARTLHRGTFYRLSTKQGGFRSKCLRIIVVLLVFYIILCGYKSLISKFKFNTKLLDSKSYSRCMELGNILYEPSVILKHIPIDRFVRMQLPLDWFVRMQVAADPFHHTLLAHRPVQ